MFAGTRKPLVVLDLCWLQALPRGEELLSKDNQYLVAPRLLLEIAARPSVRRCGDLTKLLRLVMLNRRSILIAQQVNVLAADEAALGRPSSAQDLIDVNLTRTIRNLRHGQLSKFPESLSSLAEGLSERREQFWLHFIYAHKRMPLSQAVPRRFRDIDALRAEVLSEAAWGFWERFLQGIDPHPPSREQVRPPGLCNGPRLSIVERMVRVLYYLRLKLASGQTADMDNDYDDLNYAVIGSAAGELWTHDKRLGNLMRTCFPEAVVRRATRVSSQHVLEPSDLPSPHP